MYCTYATQKYGTLVNLEMTESYPVSTLQKTSNKTFIRVHFVSLKANRPMEVKKVGNSSVHVHVLGAQAKIEK